MDWFRELFFGNSVAQIVLVYAITITVGVALGRVKIFGVSLGITWVLFVGIFLSHFGIHIEKEVEHTLKEFGLILFVFSIGLQVGPSFFASLKKQGLTLNLLALGIVAIGTVTMLCIHFITGTPVSVLAGVMSGAVTNTPGLGAAQQALNDIEANASAISTMNLGYAVAYPFGVIGIILVLITYQKVFRVNLTKEKENYEKKRLSNLTAPSKIHLNVENPHLFGKSLASLKGVFKTHYVISRLWRNGEIMLPCADTVLQQNDVLLIITSEEHFEEFKMVIGSESDLNLIEKQSSIVSRRIVVTQKKVLNKPLKDLTLGRTDYNITRVDRSGIEFIANSDTILQIGDIVTVVGHETAVESFAKILGNSLKRLDHPDLVPIFFGIALGVIFGSLPCFIPGIPAPIKIGLAGGPLIIALLISRFGSKVGLATYVTNSAALMIREIGIVLFLASVGLSSGEHFVEILTQGDGVLWMGYGALITLIPLIIIACIARFSVRCSFFEVCGLLSGASTDPPALAFATQTAGSDAPAVTYATVYPLTMICRILMAQLVILFFA